MSLGDIVKLDNALVRITEDTVGNKAISKQEFLERINAEIVPSYSTLFDLLNPKVSGAVGSWDYGSWRLPIFNKTSKLVKETSEFTDGRLPGKRSQYRDVIMFIQKRELSEQDGYRIPPSIESGMYAATEVADVTSSELQIHNLTKDWKYFETIGIYARDNTQEVNMDGDISTPTNTGWGDIIIKKVVQIDGQLGDGKNVKGLKANFKEQGVIGKGNVVVITNMETQNELATLYLTWKGTGQSNIQAEEVRDGAGRIVGSKLKIGSVSFIGIPESNMWDYTIQSGLKLEDGSFVKKPVIITTTGQHSPIGMKFLSRIFSNELQNQYGDLVVQSAFYHAITGTELIDGINKNTPIFENMVYIIHGGAPASSVTYTKANEVITPESASGLSDGSYGVEITLNAPLDGEAELSLNNVVIDSSTLTANTPIGLLFASLAPGNYVLKVLDSDGLTVAPIINFTITAAVAEQQSEELEQARQEAKELGINFNKNTKLETLLNNISKKRSEIEELNKKDLDALKDENKLLNDEVFE